MCVRVCVCVCVRECVCVCVCVCVHVCGCAAVWEWALLVGLIPCTGGSKVLLPLLHSEVYVCAGVRVCACVCASRGGCAVIDDMIQCVSTCVCPTVGEQAD